MRQHVHCRSGLCFQVAARQRKRSNGGNWRRLQLDELVGVVMDYQPLKESGKDETVRKGRQNVRDKM